MLNFVFTLRILWIFVSIGAEVLFGSLESRVVNAAWVTPMTTQATVVVETVVAEEQTVAAPASAVETAIAQVIEGEASKVTQSAWEKALQTAMKEVQAENGPIAPMSLREAPVEVIAPPAVEPVSTPAPAKSKALFTAPAPVVEEVEKPKQEPQREKTLSASATPAKKVDDVVYMAIKFTWNELDRFGLKDWQGKLNQWLKANKSALGSIEAFVSAVQNSGNRIVLSAFILAGVLKPSEFVFKPVYR